MKFFTIGVIWIPFGVQNGDFWSFGSIFSVYVETLVTIGAQKGKILLICRLLWVPFGGRFHTFFSQKSFRKQKKCYCKPEGEGICKRHEKCRENVVLEPWIWSSGCSGSSIYTIPWNSRKSEKWVPKMLFLGGPGCRFWYFWRRRANFSRHLGGLFSKGAPAWILAGGRGDPVGLMGRAGWHLGGSLLGERLPSQCLLKGHWRRSWKNEPKARTLCFSTFSRKRPISLKNKGEVI